MNVAVKKAYIILSVLLYIISFSAFSLYIYSVFSQIVYSAAARLCIIAIGALCLYFAGRISSLLLERGRGRQLMKLVFILLFGLYIFFLVTLVLFDPYFGREGKETGLWQHIRESTNLIPFKTVIGFFIGLFDSSSSVRSFIVNIFGNLCAFAPFGFFLPRLFTGQRKRCYFLITVCIAVITVEISQMLIMTGACDIDDLILNVAGAYTVFTVYTRISKSSEDIVNMNKR